MPDTTEIGIRFVLKGSLLMAEKIEVNLIFA
jgi:hypothetical protein